LYGIIFDNPATNITEQKGCVAQMVQRQVLSTKIKTNRYNLASRKELRLWGSIWTTW